MFDQSKIFVNGTPPDQPRSKIGQLKKCNFYKNKKKCAHKNKKNYCRLKPQIRKAFAIFRNTKNCAIFNKNKIKTMQNRVSVTEKLTFLIIFNIKYLLIIKNIL